MVSRKKKQPNVSPRGDLNSRPLVYKTSALTPELLRPGTLTTVN